MKTSVYLFLVLFSGSLLAQPANVSYLTAEDQKYYRNDVMDGNNLQERISLDVKEINKLHGLINQLRSEVTALRADVDELKKRVK